MATVPATAERNEERGPTTETNPFPSRLPNRPFSRKPKNGSAGMSQRWFSIYGTFSPHTGRCEECPHQQLSIFVFVADAILVILGGRRIELPSMFVATPLFFSDLQFFVVVIGDAHRPPELVDLGLIGCGRTADRRLVAGKLRLLPTHVRIAAGDRRIGSRILP